MHSVQISSWCMLFINIILFIIIIITLNWLDLLFDAAVKQCIDSAVEEGFLGPPPRCRLQAWEGKRERRGEWEEEEGNKRGWVGNIF